VKTADNKKRVEVVIDSKFELIDLVQTILDEISEKSGFDEDAAHWMGMAVREAMNNAIKHGNRLDEKKNVRVLFQVDPEELHIRVLDQGDGFDVGELPNPTDPTNLLKPSGRGIFYIRNFMDLVEIGEADGGGTEIHMTKKRPDNEKR